MWLVLVSVSIAVKKHHDHGNLNKEKTSSCVGLYLQRSSPISSLCDLGVCRQTCCWRSSQVSSIILQTTGSGLRNWHDLSIYEISKPASPVTHFLIVSRLWGSIFFFVLTARRVAKKAFVLLNKIHPQEKTGSDTISFYQSSPSPQEGKPHISTSLPSVQTRGGCKTEKS